MSYALLALACLLQLLCIIHVVRTGREQFWIYIIIFVPIAGGVAYLLADEYHACGDSGQLGEQAPGAGVGQEQAPAAQ